MLENRLKNIFRDKQTTKNVPLKFLDVKGLNGKGTIAFLASVEEKQITVHVISFYKPQHKEEKRSTVVRNEKWELNNAF